MERRACRAGGRRAGGGAPTPAPRCRPGPGSPAGTPGSVGTGLSHTDVYNMILFRYDSNNEFKYVKKTYKIDVQ